jgi:hypothetical protein
MYHDPPSALRIARRIGWEIKSNELLVVDGGRNQYKHVTVMLVWGRWKGIKVTLNLVSAVFQRISTVEQRDPRSKTRRRRFWTPLGTLRSHAISPGMEVWERVWGRGYESSRYYSTMRTRAVGVTTLADARAVTLFPPGHSNSLA